MTAVWCLWAGLALTAGTSWEYPIFVTTGPEGTLYVSDQNAPAILAVAADGAVRPLFIGSKQYRTPLYRPRGLAVSPAGDLWICDPATFDLYRLPLKGEAAAVKPVPVTGDATTLLDGRTTTMGNTFVQPEGIAFAPDGTAYVSDMKLNTIFAVAPGKENGRPTPSVVARVAAPRGLLVDADGSLVVVSNSDTPLVRVATKDGTVTPIVTGRKFQFPMSVCRWKDGYAVTDNYSRAIWSVGKGGEAAKLVDGAPLRNPTGIAALNDALFILDSHQRTLYRWSPADGLKPFVAPQ